MRKTLLSGALALCLSGLTYNSTAATTLLFDNFDSYADQAAFQAVWTPIGTLAPISAELSTEQASSPSQSIKVLGTASNGQNRNRRSFTETGTVSSVNRLTWSFDFYDGNSAASPYRNFANLQDSTAPSATSQLIGMGLNNNQSSSQSGGNFYMARILGYTVPTTADPHGGPAESVGGSGAYFKLNDFGVGYRSTGWHNLRVEIFSDDNLSTDFWFYVDGILAEKVENIGTTASIRSYDNIAIGSGLSNAGNVSYFDNMSLVVPEPSAMALAMLGGFGLLISRMRRQ